jgi:hypothetical protein
MKAYLGITGALFAIVAVTHVLRFVQEWSRVRTDPSFVLGIGGLGLVAAGLAVWAFRLFRLPPRPSSS